MQTSLQELENSIYLSQKRDINWCLKSNLDSSQQQANNSFSHRGVDPQKNSLEKNSPRISESMNQSQTQQHLSFSNSILKQMPFATFYQPKSVQGKHFFSYIYKFMTLIFKSLSLSNL